LKISNYIFLIFRRQVTYEEGENFAKENGLMFLETSARTAYNVEEAFNLSAQNILSNIEKNKMSVEDTVKTKNLKIIIYITM
jgi:Ras-related protein Rab-2A